MNTLAVHKFGKIKQFEVRKGQILQSFRDDLFKMLKDFFALQTGSWNDVNDFSLHILAHQSFNQSFDMRGFFLQFGFIRLFHFL